MQYSLFIDSDAKLSGALLVREPGGAVRPARRAEILSVARELVTLSEVRGKDMTHPDKVKTFLQLRLAGLEHEVGGLLLLDMRNHLITYLEPFRGTLGQAAVYPREIVKLALQYNAAAIIMVHNHPSGQALASREDIQLTKMVKQALALVDVRLVDHFIVAGAQMISMAEAGLM